MEPEKIDDIQRLPGFYKAWDLPQIVLAGRSYWIEDAGAAQDGSALFAVYAAVA